MTAILSQMSSYISVSTNGRAIAVDDEFGGDYFLYKITLRFSDRVYFTPKLKPGLLTRASRLSPYIYNLLNGKDYNIEEEIHGNFITFKYVLK